MYFFCFLGRECGEGGVVGPGLDSMSPSSVNFLIQCEDW